MTEQLNPELLDCPFCNGEAFLSTGQIGPSRAIAHYVECIDCAASGDMKFAVEEAVKLWNTRAPLKQCEHYYVGDILGKFNRVCTECGKVEEK